MEAVDTQSLPKETYKPRSLLTVNTDKVLQSIDEQTRTLFTNNTGDSIRDNEKTDTFLRDLVEGVTNLVNLTRQEGYDTVFFLDKSARPLEHLFTSVWGAAFPNEKKPQIRFFNNFSKSELPDEQYPASALEEFKTTFGKDVENKKVLVVDEYVSSGHSLGEAQEILHYGFPNKSTDITYTGVLKHSWVSWRLLSATDNKDDTVKKGVGVIDKGVPVVLHNERGDKVEIPTEEQRSFISKPLVNEVREAGEVTLADELQDQVNELRLGLTRIAHLIAENSSVVNPGEFKVKPYLPYPSFERQFNSNKFN